MKKIIPILILLALFSITPSWSQFKGIKKPKVNTNIKAKKKKTKTKKEAEDSKKIEIKDTQDSASSDKSETNDSKKEEAKESKNPKKTSIKKEDPLSYHSLVFDLEAIDDRLTLNEYNDLMKTWEVFKKNYYAFSDASKILDQIKVDKSTSNEKYMLLAEKAIIEMQEYIKSSFYDELNENALELPLETKNCIEIGEYFLPNNANYSNLKVRVDKIIQKKQKDINSKIAQFTKGNPIHIKYVNNTVYSHKKIANHGSENEAHFITKITDDTKPLYTRVYLGDTFATLNGYYDDYLTIEIELDGETIGSDGLKIDLPGKAKSSWFDIILIPTENYIVNFKYNPKDAKSEREFWKMKYMLTLLATKSKALDVHNLKIHYHILNKINSEYVGEKYIENTIEIALENDPNHWNKLKVMLDEKQFESVRMKPRTKTDSNLEQALRDRFMQEWGSEGWQIKMTRIVGKSFQIEKNNIDVPIGKHITMQLVATKNGTCTLFSFGFGRKYSGGGHYAGEDYIARRDDSSGIKCSNVN